MIQRPEPRGDRRFTSIGLPENQFNEIEFAHEVWSVLLGHHSRMIDCRTAGNETYKLKLSSTYTLVSERYNDTFVEGFLRRVSNALKMLTRIGRFSSNAKQSRLVIDPMPMFPFRKAARNFYKELVAAIDSYQKNEMNIDQLQATFNELSPHLETVYNLYRPVIKANESEHRQSILSNTSVVNNSSTIAFREEIEETWRQYFYKSFVCPDSLQMQLSIWNWIFEAFLEILPGYLDKIAEFTDIKIDAEKDQIVLLTDDESIKEVAYFRNLWSDRLVTFVKRAFMDRKRLFTRQKNPTTIPKQWSAYFTEKLDRFKRDNPDLKKLTEIRSTMIVTLLEDSCQSYMNQFSKIILSELQHKNRLVLRVKELAAICSLHSITDQINKMSFDDHFRGDRNSILSAYRDSLTSPILPETTAKYWALTLADSTELNPYAFKIQYKTGWPVNLIISQQFLDNLNHVLQMLTRLFHYYMNYRALAITCMFSSGDEVQVSFTRRVQNFVLSLRQVLYRLFNCLVKKIGVEMQALLSIVESAKNFINLEANVSKWHEQIRFFATDSHFALAVDALFNCAESFIISCKSMNQQRSILHAEASSVLEMMTLEVRRDFVLACEALAPPIQETRELTPFEREISLIVSHITNDKFWQIA